MTETAFRSVVETNFVHQRAKKNCMIYLKHELRIKTEILKVSLCTDTDFPLSHTVFILCVKLGR